METDGTIGFRALNRSRNNFESNFTVFGKRSPGSCHIFRYWAEYFNFDWPSRKIRPQSQMLNDILTSLYFNDIF